MRGKAPQFRRNWGREGGMLGLLGSKLKKARTELGLSQSAFARAVGFSSEFISLLEADKRAPSLTSLNKIAAYLKKDIHDFLHSRFELAPL